MSELFIKQLIQPEDSSTCGQHCVAMLNDLYIEESIALFKSKGGTRAKQLCSVLQGLGWVNCKDKLTRIKKDTVIPDICILKVVWLPEKKHSHWILKVDDTIYDPGYGTLSFTFNTLRLDTKLEYIQNGKITSYLNIGERVIT